MKTVKVRIPVVVDQQGRFYAYGWSGSGSPTKLDHLLELTDHDTIGPGEVLHWVSAELPVPESVEVEAVVETV